MLELLAERKLCPRCRAPNLPDRIKCIECGIALPPMATPTEFTACAPDEMQNEQEREEPRAERVAPQSVIPRRVVPQSAPSKGMAAKGMASKRTLPERGPVASRPPAATGLVRVVGWGAMIAGVLLACVLIGAAILGDDDLARAGAVGAAALASGIVLGTLFLGFAANLDLLTEIRSRLDSRQGPSA